MPSSKASSTPFTRHPIGQGFFRLACGSLCLLILLMLPRPVHADWTGTAGNNTYNDTNNWASGTINGIFSTVAPPTTVQFNGDITTNVSMTFATANVTTTFASDTSTVRTITLNGNFTANSSKTFTVTLDSTLVFNLNEANNTLNRSFGNLSSTGGNWIINSKITGIGGVTLGGGVGFLAMNNTTNDFTGNVSFSRRGGSFASIADAGIASALGAGSSVTVSDVSSFGNLDYTGGSASSNRTWTWNISSANNFQFRQEGTAGSVLMLSGNWTLNKSAGTLIVKADAGDLVLGGNIVDGTGSTVEGLNFQGGSATRQTTLTGTNTNTGAITVSSGILQVGNNNVGSTSASSTVTVNGATASLAGTGTVNGNITVTLGKIRPGDTGGTALGTLKTGNLTVSGGTNAIAELQLDPANSGVSDKINSTATITFSGNSHLSVLNAPTVAGTWDLLDWTTAFNFGTGGLSTLSTSGGSIATVNNDAFLDLPTLSGGMTYDLSNFINAGQISVIAAPEPTRFLLLSIGVLGCALRRRRV